MIYKVEIIFTFNTIDRQVRMRFNVDHETINEEHFYRTALTELTTEELMDVCKISICQECENEAEIIPFINICRGKIFLEDPSDPFRGIVLNIRDEILAIRN
jgi:hypothetical protein